MQTTAAALSGKRPAATPFHVHNDPRFKAAAERYSAILKDRDELKDRHDKARAIESNSQAQTVTDAATRYLAGESEAESVPTAKLWADLCVREQALTLQRQEMDRAARTISQEACAREKPKHDAIVGKLAKALRAVKEADHELALFNASLSNSGVEATFVPLGFVPAREPNGVNSIDVWLERYAEYVR